jgi:hypothetical protein
LSSDLKEIEETLTPRVPPRCLALAPDAMAAAGVVKSPQAEQNAEEFPKEFASPRAFRDAVDEVALKDNKEVRAVGANRFCPVSFSVGPTPF